MDSVDGPGPLAEGTPLFAEYALMLLACHASFCGLMRITVIATHPSAVVGIAAAAWIVVRTVRVVSCRWYHSTVTLCLVAAVLQCDCLPLQGSSSKVSPSLMNGGVFSPFVLLAILFVFLCSDVANLIRRYAQNSQFQSRCGNLSCSMALPLLVYGIGGFIAFYTFALPFIQEWMSDLNEAGVDSKFAMDRLTVSQNMLFKFSESV